MSSSTLRSNQTALKGTEKSNNTIVYEKKSLIHTCLNRRKIGTGRKELTLSELNLIKANAVSIQVFVWHTPFSTVGFPLKNDLALDREKWSDVSQSKTQKGRDHQERVNFKWLDNVKEQQN